MRTYRSAVVGLVVAVASVCVAVAARSVAAQLPLEPVRDSGQGVTGAFEGWYQNPDGSYSLLIGYMNRNAKQALDIPIGPDNRIDPGGPDQGQPTHFLPRRQWGVATVMVPKDFGNKKLIWTLTANGQTTSIPLSLNPLWAVEPLKDAATGNTPPTVRFEQGGSGYQGPPRGIGASFTTKVAEPLTLTVWIGDDMYREPQSTSRTSPDLTVTWSKFRGTGDVTFDNPKPEVGQADGTATTAARFGSPGEFVLRVQVNDTTGEGGGGSQCCWTNTLVKVTVEPAGSR